MYKYISNKIVYGRILGSNYILGHGEPLLITRRLPAKPLIFKPATQKQLQALFDLGFPDIIKEIAEPKKKVVKKENDAETK